MSLQSRIESLKDRHASLETRIAAEDNRPRPDTAALARLKVEKLRLKEEMERLRTRSIPN
ncbi:MAG TPA: YdcH family protein [Acetobacteraceae bacterium]|nr:YdcH family protein [Acetobacteraceae bacterium]